MITSIKDSNGKIFATIVPMKDGRWLEIKRNYIFRSKKYIFDSEDHWLSNHEYSGVSLMPVYGEREPYVPVAERWKMNPISETLQDGNYLKRIQEKYKIRAKKPQKKTNLLDMRASYKFTVLYLKGTELSPYLQERLKYNEDKLAETEEKIKSIGENNIQDEYFPLTRKTTIAYIKKNEDFIAVGYDNEKENIIIGNQCAKKFSLLGYPEHPNLWIWHKNSLIQAI